MLIRSQAGDFEIGIKSFEREGDDLVMVGAMGVWEARTHVTPKDAAVLLRTMLSSGAVWGFVFRLPFNLLSRGEGRASGSNEK